MVIQLFKDKTGMVMHGLALAYTALAYGLGFAGLFSGQWPVQLLATLLLAHGMVIAAYMLHECAHNTVFRHNLHNARLGKLLTWLTGSCYGTYEDIRHKHFRHHVDQADLIWFEYDRWFARHPVALKLVLVLEWCFIPAHDLLMHGLMVVGAFVIPQRRAQRLHNALAIVVRGSLYAALLWFFPRAALLYAVAYMLMITVLRFMDAVQHDYGGTPTLFDPTPLPHRGDRDHEQAHTFSNPLSLTRSWPNLLVLNFGFHNAHHARPTTPWYQLPALHRELFCDDPERVIPFAAQLKGYCRYRVARVQGDDADITGPHYLQHVRQGLAPGGNAVSFLTSF